MYYGVYGKNGGGVYYLWSKVIDSKPYIMSFRAKKFKTRDEAIEYVVNGLITEYAVIDDSHLNKKRLANGLNFFFHLKSLHL